jgi:DNA-binding NarL/FixJ family response regulator
MDSLVHGNGDLNNGNGRGSGDRKPDLTRREQEILACVAIGMSNGEIASRLHVAESTVKTHLTSAYLKLGVKNRTQAAIATLSLDRV